MKVLMISGDPGVLNPDTEAGKRMDEYRQVLGELDILLCRGNIFNFIFGFFRGLRLMKNGYDIITAQDMEHSFLAWMFSKIFGTPWQMQIHTDIFSQSFYQHSVLDKIRVWLAKFLLSRASCIRVVSERIKKSILDSRFKILDTRIKVLPVFIDIEKIKNAQIKTDLHEKYGRDKFIILMASRITKEKNIGLAIEALSSLIRANKRIVLVIVGDGPEKEKLESCVKNLELDDSIKFESYTQDLISYYKTCDLFLLTSIYEGYGMTLVESSAAGCKIISSDVGIAQEILSHEAIFKVGDKEALKQKLILALENKLPAPHLPALPTKEEYLRLYKNSFEVCLKKQKN